MTPTATPAPLALLTAAEFAAKYADVHAELVKGVAKAYAVPWPKHGFICSTIDFIIKSHVLQHDLGRVASNDSWIKTGSNPDTVRGPDVCFFSYDRFPKGEVPDGLLSVVPDLAIEVRSPSDRWNAILAKASEYLRIGVRVVAVLDPGNASVTVFRDEEFTQTLHNSDVWTLPDVLPGFSVVVSRLFE